MKAYYTVPETAKLLGKTKVTIYRWIRAKKIPFVEFGGILFITFADIQQRRLKLCSTCFHGQKGTCVCREPSDVTNPCVDWYPDKE